ncbi:transcription factor HHO3 isoform X1 [Ricinus communis]|uniref:DNA binding protein, putative n=1 Tax=Ricinus communis TaxID=3988 RepID=B9ST36_RICCO|nr:transcription factor HHO3 isoform X1 [Ricinus communis]EEF33268.1 DNA binding protein, putative [Ricinus communis]|eukprot:XP_002529155.1 transcription factor HHO3 isoform X2 [Ricinus communis]
MDYAEKMQRCHEYVEALEEEKRKIQVFQRELPLCLELVTQAIEACKRELSGTTTEYMHGQSECSEQTTSTDGTANGTGTRSLVLEEFIPIKRINSSSHNDNDNDDDNENEKEDNDDDEEEEDQDSHKPNKSIRDINNDQKKKSDWLRSVQLWNQSSPDSEPPKEDLPRKAAVTEVKRNGGAFQPFHKEKGIAKTPPSVPASATSSSAETGTGGGTSGAGNNRKEDKDGQAQRKQRRCWSPELHRRFLHALQQLGGSHAATPKQIRELMKVDGLTNDEVKSHLQKYRLHTRRPSPTIHNNSNPQAPQFVVVGGIWVPPPEYAAVAATTASMETVTTAAANGIYAPVAAPLGTIPKQQRAQSQHLQSERRGSHSERSNSPATSSSTHTTTNSPVF